MIRRKINYYHSVIIACHHVPTAALSHSTMWYHYVLLVEAVDSTTAVWIFNSLCSACFRAIGDDVHWYDPWYRLSKISWRSINFLVIVQHWVSIEALRNITACSINMQHWMGGEIDVAEGPDFVSQLWYQGISVLTKICDDFVIIVEIWMHIRLTIKFIYGTEPSKS